MDTSHTPQLPPSPVTLWQAARYWFKLGCISFGGPAGQIALMHQELVEQKRWISERRFLHALNYCMVLPGPEAQQLATYLGWLLHRTWGGLMAGVLFVLPSFFLLVGLAWGYARFGSTPLVAGLLYGIKPAVVAIVLAACWRIGKRTLRNRWLWALAVLAFVAIFVFQLPFPLIVLSAAALGYLGGRVAPALFAVGGGHAASQHANLGPALIDDHTPLPPHARLSWARMGHVALVGLGLWALGMAALLWRFGADSVYSQMGWFFTKAALLTFGGAYAVLPYVYQGAVSHFHWLGAAEMMDGLALGETTPGPLIMVVTFVGFIGGWHSSPDAPFTAALLAASLVTFFTFLPSFVFIFLGAPFIETSHGKLQFTAPLTAISAAVVGVIASLAVFFAQHTLWHGHPDWPALLLTCTATVAVFRYQVNLLLLIPACGLAGVVWQWL